MRLQNQDFRMYAVKSSLFQYISADPRGTSVFKTNKPNMHVPGSLSHAGIHLDGLEGGDVRECVWVFPAVKSTTPIEDTRSDPQILSTKRPLHFWSSIGVSNSEAPKAEFSNVCSEILTFSENWRMYHAKSLLFFENPWILNHAYRWSAIWPSNSLDKTTTPCLILDRGVDFWAL